MLKSLWNRGKAPAIFSLGFLALALLAVLYYIVFPSRGYFHADCGDTLLWANASYESGRLISRDFSYAALLPAGGSLLMLPWIPLFGVSMTTHILGMLSFALLFTGALWFLFRSLDCSVSQSAACTAATLLLLSSSDKLREIFWGHVIYYSLGLIYLIAGLGLVLRLLRCADRKRSGLYLGLLFLLLTGTAINDFQIIAIVTFPLAGALAAERFFDPNTPLLSPQNKKAGVILCAAAAATCVGLVLFYILSGGVRSGYTDAYSAFSDMASWPDNIRAFMNHWLTLLGLDVNSGDKLISVSAVLHMLRIGCAGVFLLAPFAAALEYRKLEDRSLRLLLWCHYLTSAFILFGFVFGRLSAANWRLSPMLGTAVISTLMYFQYKLKGVSVRLPAAILVAILAFSLLNLFTIANMPADYGRDNDLHILSYTLREKGLDFGYATFWQSNAIPIISQGELEIRVVDVDDSGYRARYYQSSPSWYQPNPKIQKSFLLLSDYEYYLLTNSAQWADLQHDIVDQFAIRGFQVLIFHRDLF